MCLVSVAGWWVEGSLGPRSGGGATAAQLAAPPVGKNSLPEARLQQLLARKRGSQPDNKPFQAACSQHGSETANTAKHNSLTHGIRFVLQKL